MVTPLAPQQLAGILPRQAVRMVQDALQAAGCPDADYDARELLRMAAGKDPRLLFDPLTRPQAECLAELAAQRMQRVPLQYLAGEWDFLGLTFKAGWPDRGRSGERVHFAGHRQHRHGGGRPLGGALRGRIHGGDSATVCAEGIRGGTGRMFAILSEDNGDERNVRGLLCKRCILLHDSIANNAHEAVTCTIREILLHSWQ